MKGFIVSQTDSLTLAEPSLLGDMYTLSPFVWREGERYALLLRVVPRSENPAEKIARIHAGHSENGLCFAVEAHPAIAPGPEMEDKDGCEDPTVMPAVGLLYVYYSGWNEARHEGRMLLSVGPDQGNLQKRGAILPPSLLYINPKEATIVPVADGSWRLFFEYAHEGASKIGLAAAPAVDGPWIFQDSPVQAWPGGWDEWHLSPGPVVGAGSDSPIMFYNGATQDAHWRIGWIAFDAGYTRVIARSEEPLIVPPPGEPGDTDIAFAASCVEEGNQIFLYYSVADKYLIRARLRRSEEETPRTLPSTVPSR